VTKDSWQISAILFLSLAVGIVGFMLGFMQTEAPPPSVDPIAAYCRGSVDAFLWKNIPGITADTAEAQETACIAFFVDGNLASDLDPGMRGPLMPLSGGEPPAKF
jgi:hypothetical protein